MENTDKSGPHAPASRLGEALEGAFDAAEASENAPPALPRPAHDLREVLTDPTSRGSALERPSEP